MSVQNAGQAIEQRWRKGQADMMAGRVNSRSRNISSMTGLDRGPDLSINPVRTQGISRLECDRSRLEVRPRPGLSIPLSSAPGAATMDPAEGRTAIVHYPFTFLR